MKITALTVQKKNKNRVNVYLDGRFAFGLAAIEALKLKIGQVLSESEIAQLQAKDQQAVAHERALNFLSYRPRSQAEVQQNLKKKGFDQETIDQVIARLVRAGLLDDLAFARYWLENRSAFKPRGARALRYELRQKGVADNVIDSVLLDYDDTAAAYRVASSQTARLLQRVDNVEQFRFKLLGLLQRRGFPFAASQAAVEQVASEWDSELTKLEREKE